MLQGVHTDLRKSPKLCSIVLHLVLSIPQILCWTPAVPNKDGPSSKLLQPFHTDSLIATLWISIYFGPAHQWWLLLVLVQPWNVFSLSLKLCSLAVAQIQPFRIIWRSQISWAKGTILRAKYLDMNVGLMDTMYLQDEAIDEDHVCSSVRVFLSQIHNQRCSQAYHYAKIFL